MIGHADSFHLMHMTFPTGLRLSVMRNPEDKEWTHGYLMDAPAAVPIGCTSTRQDVVERGFDAADELVNTALLRGYGHKVDYSKFVLECAIFGNAHGGRAKEVRSSVA